MREEGMLTHPNAKPLEPATAVGLLEPESGQFDTTNMTTTPESALDTSLIEGDFDGVFYTGHTDLDYTDESIWTMEEEHDDGNEMDQ
jgi:hypothetical protein